MAGIALAESLVAALLLALTLLGTASAFVEAVAGQHTALLQTTAGDLAADLAESLRHPATADEAAQAVQAWQEAVRAALPGATASATRVAGDFETEVTWIEPRSGRTRRLALPFPAPEAP